MMTSAKTPTFRKTTPDPIINTNSPARATTTTTPEIPGITRMITTMAKTTKRTLFATYFLAAAVSAMLCSGGNANLHAHQPPTAAGEYKLSRSIAIGGEGRWDY